MGMITLQMNDSGSWRKVLRFDPESRAEILQALVPLASVLSNTKWALLDADGKREWLRDLESAPKATPAKRAPRSDGPFSIDDAEELCRKHKLPQLIALIWDGEDTRVVTFGTTDDDSAMAAEAGNRIKRWLGWPEAMCRTESAKVARLHDRIEELEAQLEASASG